MTDVIDDVAGIVEGSRLFELRRQKPDLVRYSEASHAALVAPAQPGGLSLAERAATALRMAVLHRAAGLAEHYRARLRDAGGGALVAAAEARAEAPPLDPPPSARLTAILRHVDRLMAHPATAAPEHLEALRAAGLSPRDIVSLSQLIAFVSYQVRVLAGLRALAEEPRS